MRSDREILKIGNANVKDLTNKEYDRFVELQKLPMDKRYPKAHGGKLCRGRKANYDV
jgi:hypothetical protein